MDSIFMKMETCQITVRVQVAISIHLERIMVHLELRYHIIIDNIIHMLHVT